MTMPAPIHEAKPRPRASRSPIPDPPLTPQGTAHRSLRAQEHTAEARVREARGRLDAAHSVRTEADRARVADPRNPILADRAREARRAVEDAEADLVAFEGARDLLVEQHADPRIAELCHQHAELESKLSATAIASKADALIKRAEKVAELLVALDRDARELHAEVGTTANQLAAVERQLNIDSTNRTPHDYRLHRFRLAAAIVAYARSKGVDREILLTYVNP